MNLNGLLTYREKELMIDRLLLSITLEQFILVIIVLLSLVGFVTTMFSGISNIDNDEDRIYIKQSFKVKKEK